MYAQTARSPLGKLEKQLPGGRNTKEALTTLMECAIREERIPPLKRHTSAESKMRNRGRKSLLALDETTSKEFKATSLGAKA